MTTKTRKAVNLIGGARTVFNDKLKDGTRSLKVYGWDAVQYEQCAKVLREQGCQVKVVKFKVVPWGMKEYTRVITRLHVQE